MTKSPYAIYHKVIMTDLKEALQAAQLVLAETEGSAGTIKAKHRLEHTIDKALEAIEDNARRWLNTYTYPGAS